MSIPPGRDGDDALRRYYRRHAAIYDATRWTFLAWRDRLLGLLPDRPALLVKEVGSGTGRNLRRLAARHPTWSFVGQDLSEAMLARARRRCARFCPRVRFVAGRYPDGSSAPPPDVLLFSYALSLFHTGIEGALAHAAAELAPGGIVAVVDFHDTRSRLARRWLEAHGVRVDAQLLPALEAVFTPLRVEIGRPWPWPWRAFLFLGRRPEGVLSPADRAP
jgi:S-adenosylmethionine-diacylgycerolhomoserine-N-methlytransferase